MMATQSSTALSKYTVLDLSRVRAGPTAVRQLADWGANVVMVEMPEAVEGDRALGGNRRGPDFTNLHRNKQSVTLNLKTQEGVALLKRLVENADVLVENFRPDVKGRLGIDYDTLAKVNPRLIYASISGFGQEGPYAKRPGFDQVAQGMGGIMSVNGMPGQGPLRVGIPIADLTSGLFCALGILTALLERESSGLGQWVQTNLLHSQIFMLDFQAARWLIDREIPEQAGNNHPTTIPTGLFETADGHINLSVFGEKMWKNFCAVLGTPDLAATDGFDNAEGRSRNRETLNIKINDITRKETSATWIDRFNKAGIPSGPVYTIDKMFDDEQVKFLNVVERIPSPNRGAVELVGQPIKMSRTPSRLVSAPPDRGEHNLEVFRSIGLSEADIRSLQEKEII